MDKVNCKHCGSDSYVRNGIVRNKQRYKCKECGRTFIVGDLREKITAEGKALAVLLYGRGKASYGFLSKLLCVSSVAIMKLLKREADTMPEPAIDMSIKEVSFDEMWHFVDKKKANYGYGGLWSAVEIKPLAGVSGIVLLRHSGDFSENSSI